MWEYGQNLFPSLGINVLYKFPTIIIHTFIIRKKDSIQSIKISQALPLRIISTIKIYTIPYKYLKSLGLLTPIIFLRFLKSKSRKWALTVFRSVVENYPQLEFGYRSGEKLTMVLALEIRQKGFLGKREHRCTWRRAQQSPLFKQKWLKNCIFLELGY